MSIRLFIIILNIVFFKNSISNREFVSWIYSPRMTKLGDSESLEICPTNSWVGGMRLKIDSSQGWRDDTALNGIQLHCVKMDWIYSGSVTSETGSWGNYRKNKYCPRGFATGYQLRSEMEAIDDVGVVDFKLKCTNFDGTTTYVINSEYALPWGTWSSEQNCPSKTAVCGLSTQVESKQGNELHDVSSLNNLELACCKIPDPVKACELETKWKTVTICPEARKFCEIKLRTGIVVDKKQSKFAKFYEQLGFAIDFHFVQKMFKIKAKNNAAHHLINSKSLESIIGDTKIYQNKMSLQLNCEGMTEQLILICGSFKIYTKEYRCVPKSGQGTFNIFFKL